MLTASFRRSALLLLLAAVLSTSMASATAQPESPRLARVSEPGGLFGEIWSFFRKAWAKEGCTIDPSGLCRP